MKTAKLQRIGNSKGVILPSEVLKFLGIEKEVFIKIEGESIIIKKVVDKNAQ